MRTLVLASVMLGLGTLLGRCSMHHFSNPEVVGWCDQRVLTERGAADRAQCMEAYRRVSTGEMPWAGILDEQWCIDTLTSSPGHRAPEEAAREQPRWRF